MAKSLFQKGADFVIAMVFMFASTNLVVELGVVLVVLMGWQFAAAEFVGGPIMIVLLAAHRRRGVSPRPARRRGAGSSSQHGAMVGGHDHAGHGRGQPTSARRSWSTRRGGAKLRSKAAWSDAASYTMADLTMLRRELVDRLR